MNRTERRLHADRQLTEPLVPVHGRPRNSLTCWRKHASSMVLDARTLRACFVGWHDPLVRRDRACRHANGAPAGPRASTRFQSSSGNAGANVARGRRGGLSACRRSTATGAAGGTGENLVAPAALSACIPRRIRASNQPSRNVKNCTILTICALSISPGHRFYPNPKSQKSRTRPSSLVLAGEGGHPRSKRDVCSAEP